MATAPGAPTGVLGTSKNAKVVLTWTAPADNGGSAVTDYKVDYSSDGGGVWITFADAVSTSTSATITGLSNGTSYVFRVAAVNAIGVGSYSQVTARVIPDKAPPEPPTSIRGTIKNTRVILTWTAPADNGGSDVTDYIVQYSSDSGTTWQTFSDGTSTSTGATVTGLTNGTAYKFQVASVNSIGVGSYSTPSASIVPNKTPPDPPTNVVGVPQNQSATISWTSPIDNGGSAVTDYLIQYSSDSGATWLLFADAVSSATSAVITGLINDTAYIFKVAAKNIVGESAYSSTSSEIIPTKPLSQLISELKSTQQNIQTTYANRPIIKYKDGNIVPVMDIPGGLGAIKSSIQNVSNTLGSGVTLKSAQSKPTSSVASGNVGEFYYESTPTPILYLCIGINLWVKVPISSW